MHQEQANNVTETITNLDCLFQKDGNESKHAIIASNDIADSEVDADDEDDNDDEVGEYERAEALRGDMRAGAEGGSGAEGAGWV